MSRKHNYHDVLPAFLVWYANERGIEYHRYSDYHMRLIYDPVVTLDVWTSARYWIKQTSYYKVIGGMLERGNEKGWIPVKKDALYSWLDKLFFAVEIEETEHGAE